MPVYEYQCTECREVFEIFHKINEEYQDGCPNCMGQAKKILSPSNFILKGSGFYVNDYPSESRKKSEAKEKGPKESPTPKVDKPEAPAEKS